MRAIIVLFFCIFALGACGSSSAEPVNLDGQWAAEGFEAHINQGHFSIEIINEELEISTTYWDGTAPTSATEGEFVSVANKDVLARSAFGSMESSKTFKFDGDSITFTISAMGSSQTVHLTRG